ncbi:toprim domain-containing protein [Candidatus Micrarchaeota archaeon]|nr:toprim domain-containing protein [Candidatus Micrarchaeota archaeon]
MGREADLIGYNTGALHYKENTHLVQSFESLGLLCKSVNNKGYNVFGRGCIVFPLRNKQKQVAGLYFRVVEPPPARMAGIKQEKHLYLKNRQGLYPGYPNPGTARLLIPESIIDTATLQQLPEITGNYELLSSYGTNGITEEHKAAIKELKDLEEIILFFDGDEAGKEGSKARAGELQELLPGIKISIVETPENEDINSLACRQAGLSTGHEPESLPTGRQVFTELLQNRKPFIFQKKSSNESSIEDKKATGPVSTPSLPKPLHSSGQAPAAVSARASNKNGLNTTNPYKIIFATGTAVYYIKGGIPRALDSMKVTIEIENISTGRKSRQRFDLYEDKQTEKAAREAGEKLDIRADLIEMDLNYLTDLLDEHREQQVKENEPAETNKKVIIPEEQKAKCIGFLKQKQLIRKFNRLIEKSGITGEENNRIFLFVIATAYKMPDTLHAMIQGSSGSGKTYLSKQITDLMPAEDVIRLTRVTESSFYNFGEYEIQYKLIVLEDIDGLKEEAEYAFRELQSNGYITSGVSAKNEQSGYFNTVRRIVRGPIGSIATTTQGEIYEDNMSHIFLLAVDESKEQTNRIIEYLNKKSSGMINKAGERETRHFIQDCIRMLRPYEVVNPYANKILLPPEAQKIRRLTELFHAFVNQITLINQYQRKRDQQGRLITEKEDVQTAIEIMFESIILKIDELDGSLRQFYEDLKAYIMKQGEEYQNYRFTQREIRQALNISKTQIYRYFTDLLNLEYIAPAGGYSNRGFKYKITYWDDIKALRDRIKKYLNDQLGRL